MTLTLCVRFFNGRVCFGGKLEAVCGRAVSKGFLEAVRGRKQGFSFADVVTKLLSFLLGGDKSFKCKLRC